MQWCGRVREQYVMVWESAGAICKGVGGCGSKIRHSDKLKLYCIYEKYLKAFLDLKNAGERSF